MQNKNRIFEEVSRMIDLSGYGSKNAEKIKESFNIKAEKKEIVTEMFDDEDLSDLGDFLNNDVEQVNKDLGQNTSISPSDDIPYFFKIALASYTLDGADKALLGLDKENYLKIKDLFSNPIKQNDETGTIVDRPSKLLYPGMSLRDFKDVISKGRDVFSYRADSNEIDNVYQWLGGSKNSEKDFNLIGMGTPKFKLSKSGNATLNYLARILSNQPKDQEESKIISALGADARNNALRILYSFYKIASRDIIGALTKKVNLKDNEEILYFIEEGTAKAMREIASGKYNPSQNVGSFVLTIISNLVKDELQKISKYKLDSAKAYHTLTDMLERNGIITISSKLPTSSDIKAYDVEEVGGKYVYKYDNVEDALEDLENAKQMKEYNLFQDSKNAFFYSSRKAPVSMSSTVDNAGAEDEYTEKSSEEEIKKLLNPIVDFMSGNVKLYGVSNKQTEILNASQEKLSPEEKNEVLKFKKAAKQNLINYMYDTFTQVSKSVKSNDGDYKIFDNIGETGKLIFAKTYMDDWNNKTLDLLKAKLEAKYPEKTFDNDAVEKFAKEKGLLISGDVQGLFNGFKEYLTKNPETLNKMLSLISSAPSAGSEQSLDLKLEQKIRAKIQKILKENFEINEVEDSALANELNNEDNQIEVFSNRFENLLKGKFEKEDFFQDIKNVLETGKCRWTLDNSTTVGSGIYPFISSVLASMFQITNNKNKRNILTYLFVSMFPKAEYSNASMFFISKITGLELAKPENKEFMWAGVIGGNNNSGKTTIEEALDKFSPEMGSSFLNYFLNRVKLNVKNIIQKERQFMHKGKKQYVGVDSLDSPIPGAGNDDADAPTLLSKLDSKEGSELDVEDNDKNVLKFLNDFLKEKLSKTEYSIFEALVNNDFNNQNAGNDLGIETGSVRVNRSRINNKFKGFIESGELRDYILDNTGVDITKYPKIKDFIEKGEFILGDYGSNKKSDDKDSEDLTESFIKLLK